MNLIKSQAKRLKMNFYFIFVYKMKALLFT